MAAQSSEAGKSKSLRMRPCSWFLSRRIQLRDKKSMYLERVAGYHPLGECDNAKVASLFAISDLHRLERAPDGAHNIRWSHPSG
jgi:hypothetical protein